ncbi:MAG: hypothetical protein WA705_19630 [Candidatus Ozemobacteraceae bacterium]
MIKDRAVHLHSLAERLKEPPVKKIIETILIGEIEPEMAEGDDCRLCLGLGLVVVDGGTPQIANPIYREVIPRVLNQVMQYAIPAPEYRWKRDDGSFDMPELKKQSPNHYLLAHVLFEESGSVLTIDLIAGKVVNYLFNRSINMNYKTSDCCEIVFEKSDGKTLRYSGYVPRFFPGKHFGDYIELSINKAGTIEGFAVTDKEIDELLGSELD